MQPPLNKLFLATIELDEVDDSAGLLKPLVAPEDIRVLESVLGVGHYVVSGGWDVGGVGPRLADVPPRLRKCCLVA